MEYTQAEILQTVAMTEMEHLDVRTVTLGLSLLDCAGDSLAGVAQKAGDKIRSVAARLVKTVDEIGDEFGIRVANKRISITPVSLITESARGDLLPVARAIDDAARSVGIDFIGGYSALVQKGTTRSENRFLDSIPEALATTERRRFRTGRGPSCREARRSKPSVAGSRRDDQETFIQVGTRGRIGRS